MCDTIVVNRRFSEERQNILVKNSDRPLGECQPLGYFPAGTTREPLPFVKETDLGLFAGTGLSPEGSRYAVLGSRPYWLYGFEMGANEKGLFIGNEAEGSRCPAEKEEGILGMDMLRYALEAAATAQEAIRLIGELLARYGQSANASRLFDRRYENTYILCDPKETWVMETAGREWAAKKIPYFETVSNCYTIETEYDLCSENMVKTIRDNRWLHPEEPVNFAKAYTAPAPRQRMSVPRRNRMSKLMLDVLTSHIPEKEMDHFEDMLEKDSSDDKKILSALQTYGCRTGLEELSYILTDHFSEEINEGRFSRIGGENCSICMHANTRDEAQTAASMLMTYADGLGYRFRWAPASPCESVYLPVWWVTANGVSSGGPVLPELMSRGGETYDGASLWWVMERLVTLSSVDDSRYDYLIYRQLDDLSYEIRRDAANAETEAKALVKKGDLAGAQKLLDSLTARFAEELLHTAAALCEGISEEIRDAGGLYGPRKEFLEEYAARTQMPL